MATIFINLKQKLNQQMRFTIAAIAILAASAIKLDQKTPAKVNNQLL